MQARSIPVAPQSLRDTRFAFQLQLDTTRQQLEICIRALEVLDQRQRLAQELYRNSQRAQLKAS
ncbi:hypothetical protein Pan161_02200 [Gimesia algae]|uniref:Uncharacterized protein n=1 Tax=Gimesia algae TaxID=2527971 RepID=A0A517V6G6_9PLAN|nr:hypothetical protein Pan161_02200 [Gimesia algae]